MGLTFLASKLGIELLEIILANLPWSACDATRPPPHLGFTRGIFLDHLHKVSIVATEGAVAGKDVAHELVGETSLQTIQGRLAIIDIHVFRLGLFRIS